MHLTVQSCPPSSSAQPWMASTNLPLQTEAFRVFRVAVVGSLGCGKSSLIHRFVAPTAAPPAAPAPTLGCELVIRELTVDHARETLHVHLWTVGGHARFRPQMETMLPDMHAVLFLFDLGSPDSFAAADAWYHLVCRHNPRCHMFAVGCKSDCDKIDGVSAEGAVAWADGLVHAHAGAVPFFATSAVSGAMVDRLWETLIARLMA